MKNNKISKFLAIVLSAATFTGATLSGGEVYATEPAKTSNFISGAVVGVGMTVAGGALALGLCKLKANKFTLELKRKSLVYKNKLERAKTTSEELTEQINNPFFELDEESKPQIKEKLEKLEKFANRAKEKALEGKGKFFSPVLSSEVKVDLKNIANKANALGSAVIELKNYLDSDGATAEICKALNDLLVRMFNGLNETVERSFIGTPLNH